MVYLVTWDLNKEGAAYNTARARLVTQIERFDSTYDSDLDSVRFISTTMDSSELSTNLRTFMDSNDKIIVTQLQSGRHQGWLSQSVWDWINARL